MPGDRPRSRSKSLGPFDRSAEPAAAPRRILKAKRDPTVVEMPPRPERKSSVKPRGRSMSRSRPAAKKQKANSGAAVPQFEKGEPLPACEPIKVPPQPVAWSSGRLKRDANFFEGYWKPMRPAVPEAAKPFECKARGHWSFRDYRNKYGPYAEWTSLVDYFQTITPDPASFVQRNMKSKLNLQAQFKRGRTALNNAVRNCPNTPPSVTGTAPLVELQKLPEFHNWVRAVTEDPYRDVCARTQAHIVLFARAGFKQDDLRELVPEFAKEAELLARKYKRSRERERKRPRTRSHKRS